MIRKVKFIFFSFFSFFYIFSCEEKKNSIEKLDLDLLDSLSTEELMIKLKNYFENFKIEYEDEKDLKEKLKIESENQKIIRKTISNRIKPFYKKFIKDNTFEEVIEKNIEEYNELPIIEKNEKYYILYNKIFCKEDFYENDKLINSPGELIYNLKSDIVEILFKRSAKFLAFYYFCSKLKLNTKYLPKDLKDRIDNFDYERLLERFNGIQTSKEDAIKIKILLMK